MSSTGPVTHANRLRRGRFLASVLLLAGALPAHPASGQMSLTASGPPQTTDEVRPLAPGKTVVRELKGGEAHTYSVSLRGGEFLRVEIEQQGIDVVATLRDGAGAELIKVNLLPDLGTEQMSYEARDSGEYRLELRAAAKTSPGGRYGVTSTVSARATARDRERSDAERLLMESATLREAGGKENLREAVARSGKSIALWRKLGDKYWLSYALNQLGLTYHGLGEREKALDHHRQALSFCRAAGEQRGQAVTLKQIGRVYDGLGARQRAISYFRRALALFRTAGDRRQEAMTLFLLGRANGKLGEQQSALDYFNQALSLCAAIGDPGFEAEALNSIAIFYNESGEPQKALDFYQQVLPLHRRSGDRKGEADVLIKMGLIYGERRETQKALDSYNEALRLYQAAAHREGEADTLNNIGLVYENTGEPQKALDYYDRALALYKTITDPHDEAQTLANVGFVYNSLGQRNKALEYYERALPLSQSIGARKGEAALLSAIGDINLSLVARMKALDFYSRALAIHEANKDRNAAADTLSQIGDVSYALGERRQAIGRYEQAHALFRATNNRRQQAAMLRNIGAVYEDLGRKKMALDYYERSQKLFKILGDRAGEVGALNDIGDAYYDLGRERKALESYRQALGVSEDARDVGMEARARFNIGYTYNALGEHQEALAYYEQSLKLRQQLGNHSGQLQSHLQLADTYAQLGDKQKAIENYVKALPLHREFGERREEAETLMRVGELYASLDDTRAALEQYAQALKLRRSAGDLAGEAEALMSIADLNESTGERQKALEYYQLALPLWKKLNDRGREAQTLDNISSVYVMLNQKRQAFEPLNQLLSLHRAARDRVGELGTVNKIGLIHYLAGESEIGWGHFTEALRFWKDPEVRASASVAQINAASVSLIFGEFQKALRYYQQVSSLATATGNPRLKAASLASLGKIYSLLDDDSKALSNFQEALSVCRRAGDRQGEVALLNEIGSIYSSRQDNAKFKVRRGRDENGKSTVNVFRVDPDVLKAEQVYAQALSLYRVVGNDTERAKTLTGLGYVAWLRGNNGTALDYYREALLLVKTAADPTAELSLMYRLMKYYDDTSNPGMAIHFGKQAVNEIQSLRSTFSQLDKNLEKSFFRLVADPYRELISLLVEQGRLLEAEQVLRMLKAEEFFGYVRGDGDEARALTATLSFTPQESELEKRYRAIADRVAAIAADYGALLMKKGRSRAEELRLARLEKDLETAREAFQSFLDQMATEFARSNNDAGKEDVLRDALGIQETLRELGQGSVALLTVVGEDKFRLILITPDAAKAYEYPITAADLNCKVLAFRSVLQSPDQDPVPLARELYRILIGPELARDLAQAKAQTLMWSLDGTLRYLPVAALHDGESYLVEKYRNTVFSQLLTSNLKDRVSETWKGLGLGVSKKYQGFSPLPAVRAELDGIIKDETDPSDVSGALTGRIMLDDSFTEEAMKTWLRQRYPLVHIASHFSFRPGSETDSFLLLGDGAHLDVAGIKRLSFGGVELLTLSACDTAAGGGDGNGKEVEGFSVLAQRQGAKAVMASLWPVADDSTQQFMAEFYRWRQANPSETKAEALRAAQLFLLSGKAQTDAPAGGRRAASGSLPASQCARTQPPFVHEQERPFAHPYYWAPFILIGNWR